MQMEYITHATDAAELIRTKRSSPTLFKAFINITAAAASPLPKLPLNGRIAATHRSD